MTSFFCLSAPPSERAWAAWSGDEVRLEPVLCPKFSGHQRTGKRLSRMSVVLPSPKVDDFVWTLLHECLVQASVIRLLRRHRISGWMVRAANAKFKRLAKKPPRLWEFKATGWAGLAPTSSGIRLKKWCRYCGDTLYSPLSRPASLIDVKKWDGSDVFIVWPLPMFIFVTSRVVSVLSGSEITGWTATPVENLRIRGGFSPGRLSYYMPAPLAHSRVVSPEMD